jgi:hypothetical protein
MCYGSKEQVSSIVRQYVEREGGIEWITGRDFWEFISDDPNCIDEIYEIAASIGERFMDTERQTLSEILNIKIKELTTQFERLYGMSGNAMWKNLLKRNS